MSSRAGDVDGDVVKDDIVGNAFYETLGAFLSNSGEAIVYSGASGALIHTFDGTADNEWPGWSVSGAGDVNPDGFDDLVVDAPGASQVGRTSAGSVHVYSGVDGSLFFDWDGLTTFSGFGWCVAAAAAGDVNADGFDDVIIGNPRDSFHSGGLIVGVAWLYSGLTGL